ncbi:MAG: DUF1704 domain-containing protein [Candidatus Peribacteraceae bacterium]|nr:DUF1704 domain-containing protein [Candidatus Peribacteraceae bacterium]
MFFPFLNNRGVLGLNARNLLFIKPFNPRKAVAFADDKMKTKMFLSARGIPTAKVFARIETRRQLKLFDFSSLPDECVLKPNAGFGGEGIIILKGRRNGVFLAQGKTPIEEWRLREHIEDILDGRFAVSGSTDTAFFEQILTPAEGFAPFRPAGLPDIRIVVFNLVPVMAMLRIPTAESGGKANVHLGGMGIGIDLAKGVTTHAAQYHHILKELPHGMSIAGIEIPRWNELLLIASRIQSITNIGYLAVDLTLDRDMGPVLLEVNARAGLMVQVANLAPLRSRLDRVEGLNVSSPEKGVRIAQELFGERLSQREKEEEEKRPILGPQEILEISGDGFTVEERCVIAPEREQSTFSADLIEELRKEDAIEPVEGSRGAFKVKFVLGGKRIQTLVRAGTEVHPARAIIGRRDLTGFLIDPGKRLPVPTRSVVKKDLRSVDHLLAEVDHDLQLLKYLRPVNLQEEVLRLRNDRKYNPIFLQRECRLDLKDMEESVLRVEIDETPLGILLKKKRRELLLKIELLRARGDPERFTAASLALYGRPSPALTGFAELHARSQVACDLPQKDDRLLSARQVEEQFNKVLLKYGLHDWQIIVKPDMVSDCAVGEKKIFIREDASFSHDHVSSLIAHEIETHVLTGENGAAQPYDLFRRGFANYLDTQEGLAIFNQIRILPPNHEKRFLHARQVLGVSFALEHSFAETRNYLEEDLSFSEEKALAKAIDLKRGLTRTESAGGFTRAIIYFRGYRAIEQYVKEGGDLRKLYIGKIALEDLPLLEHIDNIKEPILLPEYLQKTENGQKKIRRNTGKRRR